VKSCAVPSAPFAAPARYEAEKTIARFRAVFRYTASGVAVIDKAPAFATLSA